MEIGLFVNQQATKDEDSTVLIEGLLDMTRTAERVGFDHVCAGQHFLSDYTEPQLIPFLSRITAEIESVDVSTGALILPLHHPIAIAEYITTIDSMHGGNTYLGVAAGYRDIEFDNFGVSKSNRARHMDEGVEIITRLLHDENVTFDGELYELDKASLSLSSRDEIPIWVAANSNKGVRRAATLSDGWLINPHSTISEIEAQKKKHYDPIRMQRNESNGVPMIRECFVAETTEEAISTAKPYLQEKYDRYVQWGQHEAMEDSNELGQSFSQLSSDRFVLGTPAEVCAELDRYKDRLNIDLTIFRVNWPGLSYSRASECIELVGDEVIPHI